MQKNLFGVMVPMIKDKFLVFFKFSLLTIYRYMGNARFSVSRVFGRAGAVGCAPAAQSCAVETTPNTECKVVLGVVSVGLLV